MKNSKALIFEQREGNLYERNGFGYSETKLIEKNKHMNFKIIMPFFYLLKFVDNSKYPLMDEILSLYIEFLCKSSANQIESYNQNYMKMILELIKEIPTLD